MRPLKSVYFLCVSLSLCFESFGDEVLGDGISIETPEIQIQVVTTEGGTISYLFELTRTVSTEKRTLRWDDQVPPLLEFDWTQMILRSDKFHAVADSSLVVPNFRYAKASGHYRSPRLELSMDVAIDEYADCTLNPIGPFVGFDYSDSLNQEVMEILGRVGFLENGNLQEMPKGSLKELPKRVTLTAFGIKESGSQKTRIRFDEGLSAWKRFCDAK